MDDSAHVQPLVTSQLGRSVSIEHAGRLLGVSRRTIYNRIRDGRLQTIRTPGGSQRVLVSSLGASAPSSAVSPAAQGHAAGSVQS